MAKRTTEETSAGVTKKNALFAAVPAASSSTNQKPADHVGIVMKYSATEHDGQPDG